MMVDIYESINLNEHLKLVSEIEAYNIENERRALEKEMHESYHGYEVEAIQNYADIRGV